ncbi:MAG: helix-turn-helix domain-containing protein [Pseudomonadota bacterium]
MSAEQKHTHTHWSRSLLNENELAQYLNIEAETLKKWRRLGQGPAFTKVGKSVRYRWQEIERYLDAQTVSNTAEARALTA